MERMDTCSLGIRGYEYDTLMNLLHVSVSKHLLDQHFTLIWANNYYYEMTGYTKEITFLASWPSTG